MNELQKKYQSKIKEMVSVCHKLAEDKYVTSHGGNISLAADRSENTKSNILITPSRKPKGEITFNDICITDFEGKVLYAPLDSKPTCELPFHLFFFHKRSDIVSIVHGHPPYATAFSISKGKNYLSWPILPETTTEIGPAVLVPYVQPGTEKLAKEFEVYLDKYNAFLMENHGVTIVSKYNVERTRQLMDITECTAATIINALIIGKNIKPLSKEEVEILQNVIEERNLPLPGKPGVWKKLSECYNFEEISKQLDII